MNRLLGLFIAFGLITAAQAQSVQQSGSVTQKHVACWVTTGVIGDCGTAASNVTTSFGTTGQGSTICANSAPVTGPRNQLCLSANTNSNAALILQNYGGAAAQGLDLIINGTTVSIPTGFGSTIITGNAPFNAGNIPCFLNTSGTLIDCGLTASAGTITGGSWNGTPVAVAYGGTGGTTAALARTNLGLGTLAIQDAGAVAITGGTITGLPTPVGASDAATKGYVDATATGLSIHTPVVLTTAAVLPNTPTYSNGTAGVGATLTAGANAALTVDSTSPTINQRVLVKNQTSTTGCTVANAGCQNGAYTVTTVGDGSTPWVLTRATDFDTAAEMLAGSYFLTTSGSVNAGSSFVLVTTVATVGTTPATFNQFSSTVAGVTSFNTRTGSVTLTAADVIAAGQLEVLTANRIYYTRPDGNDACNGLTNAGGSSGACAFLTIQKGANVAYQTLNWAGFNVTVNVADGTYGAGASISGKAIGQTGTSVFSIVGNNVTPTNVVVASSSTDTFTISNGAVVTITGLQAQTPNPGTHNCFTNQNGSILTLATFAVANCGVNQISTAYQSLTLIQNTSYLINGSPGFAHYYTTLESTLLVIGTAVTITNNPGWGFAFLVGAVNSYSHLVGSTFTGASTGQRFYLYMNAVYSDGSSNSYTFLPGSTSGYTMSGAVYNNDYEYNSWTTYVPTFTIGSGTAGTAAAQYKSHGKDLHINAQVTITSAGSATVGSFNFPAINNYYNLALITPATTARALACVDSAGGICGALVSGGASAVTLFAPGGAFVGGRVYVITGTIEIQ